MEVETQTLPTFNLEPKPYNISLDSHECQRFDLQSDSPVDFPLSGDLKGEDFDFPASLDESESPVVSPISGDLKCEDFDFPASLDESVLPVESPVSGDLKCEKFDVPASVSSAKLAPARFAVKLQKMYRGHRTRRRLADSAVVAEELWWQALDYARLNHSTISFFNFSKPETVSSRWNRVKLNASKVGQGLSKDAEAQKLAFQHWIEAIDPQHRYGHSLHLYYEEWVKADAGQPFFYWLDIGDGKEVDLKDCPRSKLRKQCIKYLGPQEREHYEYTFLEGRLVHKQTGNLLDTNEGSKGAKWIFVMSTYKKLYAGEKKKGVFHHSSFLAGGATLAAGRLVADNGVLKSISAYSGHYRPTDERLTSFLSFLSNSGINLDEVKIHNAKDDYDTYSDSKSDIHKSDSFNNEEETPPPLDFTEELKSATKNEYKRTLSGGLHSPRADIPKNSILERINSKKAARSYQLGHQLSLKWSTGAGPRIGCVADYPLELRQQALEFVNLSPRASHTPSSPYGKIADSGTPRSHLAPDFSNGDVISGI